VTRSAIGVDIGTTSTKAVVYAARGRRRGKALGEHAVGYPLETPVPGAAEQDPERILQAVPSSSPSDWTSVRWAVTLTP